MKLSRVNMMTPAAWLSRTACSNGWTHPLKQGSSNDSHISNTNVVLATVDLLVQSVLLVELDVMDQMVVWVVQATTDVLLVPLFLQISSHHNVLVKQLVDPEAHLVTKAHLVTEVTMVLPVTPVVMGLPATAVPKVHPVNPVDPVTRVPLADQEMPDPALAHQVDPVRVVAQDLLAVPVMLETLAKTDALDSLVSPVAQEMLAAEETTDAPVDPATLVNPVPMVPVITALLLVWLLDIKSNHFNEKARNLMIS